MEESKDKLPSLRKLSDDIKGIKLLTGILTLGGNVSLINGIDKNTYQETKKIGAQLSNMISNLEKFNSYFSEHGWIAYEHMKVSIIEDAVATYESSGLEKAENILLEL